MMLADNAQFAYSQSMNTVAVVVVSLFAGAVLIVIVGALGWLIYLYMQAKKRDAQMMAAMDGYAAEFERIVDSAKASFTGIRQEIKSSQSSIEASLVKSLELHDQAFQQTMARINPVALEAASAKILSATGGIVKVASTLQALLVTHDVPQAGVDLLPEEYGPDDTIYARQSDAARLDQAAERAEVEANPPQYEGSIA